MADEGLTALLDIGYYNGWMDFFKNLADYLDKNNDVLAEFPEDMEVEVNGTIMPFGKVYSDLYPRIVWSWLVLKYGDYGTSPRYGWILKENIKLIANQISEYIKEMTE